MKKATGIVLLSLLAALLFWVAFSPKLPNAIENIKTGKTLRQGSSFRGVGSNRSF